MKISIFKYIVTTLLLFFIVSCKDKPNSQWLEDFKYQPTTERPALEVSFIDSTRTAFEIMAQDYKLIGQLEKPHLLKDSNNQDWLWMEMADNDGNIFSTQFSEEPSRINLYRRGPYFNEIHWFDIQLVSEDGIVAPLKGDLALYCYPEKILAEITWHATDDFKAKTLNIKGTSPKDFELAVFEKESKQSYAFPLFGEKASLPDNAFTLLEGKVPVRYNATKGYYSIGTETTDSFQEQFYEIPNRYETATFSFKNDSIARKIYVCHESVVGGAIVEGGALLDKDGHNMPIVIQVSKNFPGEKEEEFYNPEDTPFSETFFPLYLEPEEEMTLTSLHLYQNWGRHMTKHWSSLGAWMDYFHSSTGVTETTCYVPFKYAGLGGVSIADFRAMSQETFWIGQPQHDNLAGHSFLSFYDGEKWQHAKYESTVYRSTGPNWYDVQLNYISADGSIKITADIWETPQADELRSFFKLKYEVLKPLNIADAQANFRLLGITSVIQELRFQNFAASGLDASKIDFSKFPFPIKGHKIPSKNSYMAEYGDSTRNRGSNAVVLREFKGPQNIGPAVTLQIGAYKNRFKGDKNEDTRLLLVPDVDQLKLKPGDVFEIDGYWLPYGERDNAKTSQNETLFYGVNGPKVVSCKTGIVESDLPVKIKAIDNKAEFTIKGGKDLLPVIITGLTDWKYPRIWKKEKDKWHLLSHSRNTAHDGYQVFSEAQGTFGAVFLIASDENDQILKVTVGEPVLEADKIVLNVDDLKPGIDKSLAPITFGNSRENKGVLSLNFPKADTLKSELVEKVDWKSSEGNSLWFESEENGWTRGGRISPNQEDLDLEYWWQNNEKKLQHRSPTFFIDLSGTTFEDLSKERTWVLTSKGWQRLNASKLIDKDSLGVIAVESDDGGKFLCMVWNNSNGVSGDGKEIGVSLTPVNFELHKRYHVRGKVYLMEGDLEVLRDRISKETGIIK
ncbi:hypothetical protein MWU78_20745 [Arenibacter sp. F26102]|uniref:hypothetical protein n=1 Tax=Arenibacter sp. F26102 TaxID=2926416 RepID=UPI001FF2765B|nr:hypothetical protein [Arenibacter sp. F26102]MCK0148087.1 hypothetical protein [Arenibacter sp. F26102]